jgi:hypothetical protein
LYYSPRAGWRAPLTPLGVAGFSASG